jgi:hypothetical protein
LIKIEYGRECSVRAADKVRVRRREFKLGARQS